MAHRLAVVVSHPIQHFVPFYRALAEDKRLGVVVLFASRIGVEPYFDKGMSTTISWNMDLLNGYDHLFLSEASRISSTGLLRVNNPSVGPELNRQKPDAVLIYGYSQITSLRALIWCMRRRVPALLISDSELKAPRANHVRLLKRAVLPTVLRRFSAFLTVGDCNEAYYAHYGVNRACMFRSPFTIDEENYLLARRNRAKLRAQVRDRFDIDEEEVVALTVGKLSKRKRPGDIIETARRLRSASLPSRVSFLLAGNGEEMDRLKGIVAAEDLPVRLLGFVNVDQLPGIYAAADMVVHPSSKDPHPLVMSEAACIGLPLLVSDRVGATGETDIARDGENTVIFPCGDISRMSAELTSLVRAPGRRMRMAQRSMQIYDELDMRRSVAGAVAGVQSCMK